MGVFDFGRQLIQTKDLDPVYCIVYRGFNSSEQLRHWLLAYWCYYHCGTASWISEQPDFWVAMMTAAKSKEYPRSTERRHYRGRSAVRSVEWLESVGLDALFGSLVGAGIVPASLVMAYVREWYMFGDWIAFKVADMVERLGLRRIVFRPEDVFEMFDSPRKGADLMAERHGPCSNGDVYGWAHDRLDANLGAYLAPPFRDRRVNVQEYETILCKWHSHCHGHYEIGKDIAEVRHGLLRFARCKTAQQLIKQGRQEKLWS